MARYKTKPCEIEAIQFTNASIDEVIEFTEGKHNYVMTWCIG